MRHRTFALLSTMALVLAACAGDGSGETTTTADETTTTPEPEVEAVQLAYELEPGTTYDYEVELDQTIEMTTSGDTAAMGATEGEELPEQMTLHVTGTSVFTHAVAEGPEPGTYEITITGDFSGMEFSGTVDGEPAESSDIPDMAQMAPVDVTIVVDEQGNVIPDDQSGLGGDLLGDLGGLGMLDQFGAGGAAGHFVGPPLTEDEVTVGDTWTETVEIPTLPGDEPITTESESEVVGTDTIDGVDVFVIETTNSTSAVEFDLAQLLIGFMGSFGGEEMTEEERAEMDAVLEDLRFAISVDPQVANLTTWFDFEAGLARQTEQTSDTHMVMDINIPDETTGEMVGFEMDMEISQVMTYRLVDTSDA